MSTRCAGRVGWVVRRALQELLKRPSNCMPRCVRERESER